MSKLSLTFLYVGFLLTLFEVLSFGSFVILRDKVFFLKEPLLDSESLQKVGRFYDADLGWLISKRGSISPDKSTVFCFGDSFTYGDEVSATHSWPFYLEKSLGRPVYNGGEPGYGIGQSYLKMKKYLKAIESGDVVVLGMITNNIYRMAGRLRSFQENNASLLLTKPRFILDEKEGVLKILENPVRRKEDLVKLNQIPFLKMVGKQDYWYQVFEPPVAQFPYSRLLVRSSFWDAFWKYFFPHRDYMKRVEFLRSKNTRLLYRQILQSFFQEVKKQGGVPLLVHFPKQEEIETYRQLGKLSEGLQLTKSICQEIEQPCFFPLESEDIYKLESLDQYFMPQDHYSPRMNQIMGQLIFEVTNKLKQSRNF